MIKNERLVFSMSIQQRIRLITSAELYKSRAMDGYAFPQMQLLPDPMQNGEGRVTRFPSLTALACAFDGSVVRRVYDCIGNEAKARVENAYFDINNRPDETATVRDPFLAGELAAGIAAGCNKSGMLVNYNDMSQFDDTVEERIDSKLITDAVMRQSEPTSAIVRESDKTGRFLSYKYGGLLFGLAQTKEDVARFLSEGCSFVFLASDFTDELVPYLTALTAEYKDGFDACARGKITPEKLDMCCRELTMLPEARINEACDAVIDLLLRVDANNADAVFERCVPLVAGEKAAFDERKHDDVALEAARATAVLIKNDGVLPLAPEKNVAVFGEYAKDRSYHEGTGTAKSYLPFDVINDYDIRTVGFAYGYRRGEPVRNDLWTTAHKLCNKADVALVYFCALPGEHTLPTEQLDFLDALQSAGKKIVAVVASDGRLDMEFAQKCNAVLLTHRSGQKTAHAVFDILTGFVPPAGRLPYAVRMHVETDGSESGAVRYPLGYGLGYTQFSYENLQLSDKGARITVRNTGDKDGYAVVLLYVQKKATKEKAAGERRLRGFAKVFIRKNGVEKVEIPFDEGTFRAFNFSKGQYCIEGGEYLVTAGETEDDVRLRGELTLRAYVYDEEKSKSTQEETDSDGAQAFRDFAETESKKAFYLRNRTTSAGMHILIAAVIALYFDLSAILLLIAGILPAETYTYLCVGVVLAAINVLALVYGVRSAKRSGARSTAPTPMTEDVVAQLDTFRELATVSYEKPIPPQDAEEEEELASAVEDDEPTQEEETPAFTYDIGFTEGTRQQINFRNDVSFPELCDNFRAYCLSWGVDVDPSSVRALLSAMAASKLVFVDVKNKAALSEFTVALGTYFQGADVTEASENWKSPADLFWVTEGDKYTASGFVNSVYAAERTPDKNAVALITRVRTENVRDWFGDVIRYALYPAEKHILKLNDTTQVVLPHNLHYLLFTENGCEGLSPDLAAASVQIELSIAAAAAPGEPTEIKPVSRRAFDELVVQAREQYYLPETVWKKWDAMAEAINAGEPFCIDNKSVLQLERLTSVLLSCGADESEAFSAAFTSKIVAMLQTLAMYRADKGDKAIFTIIEKLFADENLTKIRKALLKASRGK